MKIKNENEQRKERKLKKYNYQKNPFERKIKFLRDLNYSPMKYINLSKKSRKFNKSFMHFQ